MGKMKIADSIGYNFCLFIVALEGFEPSQAEPESDVLPLHHKARLFDIFVSAKIETFFRIRNKCCNFA